MSENNVVQGVVGQVTQQVQMTANEIMELSRKLDTEWSNLEELVNESQKKGIRTVFGEALSNAFRKYREEEMDSSTRNVKDISEKVDATQKAISNFSEGVSGPEKL